MPVDVRNRIKFLERRAMRSFDFENDVSSIWNVEFGFLLSFYCYVCLLCIVFKGAFLCLILDNLFPYEVFIDLCILYSVVYGYSGNTKYILEVPIEVL